MEGERVGVSLQLSVVLQPTVRVELRISAGGSDDGKPLPDPVDTKAAAKAARSLMQQGAKLTLLIVDDDPFERKVLDILVSEANRENLGSVYFDTILCSSTKEALAVAESRGKDVQLVLLDVLMAPGEESGDMAVPALRSALPPGVAIVMISATQEMSLVMRCIAMGADTFLPKPLPRFFMRYLWMFWLQSAPSAHSCTRQQRAPPSHRRPTTPVAENRHEAMRFALQNKPPEGAVSAWGEDLSGVTASPDLDGVTTNALSPSASQVPVAAPAADLPAPERPATGADCRPS